MVGDVASWRPSFGIGQVRLCYHLSASEDDNAKRSTVYTIDYMAQLLRSCYHGKAYVAAVKANLAQRVWATPEFLTITGRTSPAPIAEPAPASGGAPSSSRIRA